MGKKSKNRQKQQKKAAAAAATASSSSSSNNNNNNNNNTANDNDNEGTSLIIAEAYRFMHMVKVRQSPIHGLGVFATQSWQPAVYAVPRSVETFNLDLNNLGLHNMNSSSVGPWRKLLVRFLDVKNDDDDKSSSFSARMTEQDLAELRAIWEEYAVGNNNNSSTTTTSTSIDDHHRQQGAHYRYQGPTMEGTTISVLTTVEPGQEILRHYGNDWLGIKYFDLRACYKYIASRLRDYPAEVETATNNNKNNNKVMIFFFDMKNLDSRLNDDTKTGAYYVDPEIWEGEKKERQQQQQQQQQQEDDDNDNAAAAATQQDLVAVTHEEIGFWADCLQYLGETYLAVSNDMTQQLMWAGKKFKIDKYCP